MLLVIVFVIAELVVVAVVVEREAEVDGKARLGRFFIEGSGGASGGVDARDGGGDADADVERDAVPAPVAEVE